jgi:hypothetical protein
MRVRVVFLWHEGARLSAEEVRQQAGLVGTIRLHREPGGCLGEWKRLAILTVPSRPALELHGAQLVRWDERGLVLAGEEQVWKRRECFRHRQAWWCRPLGPGAPGGVEGADPLDEDEEREQLALA